MLFGQSIFQSVLDRLDADKDVDTEDDAAAAFRIRGLNAGFAAAVREGVSAASARPDQAYVDMFEAQDFAPAPQPGDTEEGTVPPVEAAPAKPVIPEHLSRLSPEEVAAELAITSEDTVQSLNEKRRAFAKANHPDGVALPFRDNATTRMKIANLLIDQALRRLAPPTRSPRRAR